MKEKNMIFYNKEICFDKQLTVISGTNGAGKTSLLKEIKENIVSDFFEYEFQKRFDIFKQKDIMLYINEIEGIIHKVMPSFSDIKVEYSQFKNKHIFIRNENDVKIELINLSTGEQKYLTLFASIAYQYFVRYRAKNNKKLTIFIDDLDDYLDIKLQRKVIKDLLTTFKNFRFVITTRSPTILSEVYPEQVYIVGKHNGTNISLYSPKQTYGLNILEIVREIIGDSGMNIKVQNKLDLVDNLINEDKFAKAKLEIEKLKKQCGGDIPSIIGAEATIFMLT